ncbi:MAG: hypothetical protein DHS80DRAFT_12191 [Piptocephalis tieghemiana]|nr:MAG: hypothetical protein DHS80DRAFT_12191 [Piptocephalis tieghemiana]
MLPSVSSSLLRSNWGSRLSKVWGDSSRSRLGEGGEGGCSSEGEVQDAERKEQVLQKQDYLLLLAKSLVQYGAPNHRIDLILSASSKALGIETSFTMVPGIMIVVFGNSETHTSETKIMYVFTGMGMAFLERTNQVAREVRQGWVSTKEGMRHLESIAEAAEEGYWSLPLMLAGNCMAGFCSCLVSFNGVYLEACIAGGLGLMCGILSWASGKLGAFSDIYEFSATVMVSFIAASLHHHVCFEAVVLSSTVFLLPGTSLTMGLVDTVSQNMLSGAVRMGHALFTAFVIGFGVNMGDRMWRYIEGDVEFTEQVELCSYTSDHWYFVIWVPINIMTYVIGVQGSAKQVPITMVVASLGYLSAYLIRHTLGLPMAAPTVAAFVVGLISNVYARLTQELAVVPVVSSVNFLTPGAVGIRGTWAFLHSDAGKGVTFAEQMFVVALSVATGLFLAGLVVMPFGKRTRSALMAM